METTRLIDPGFWASETPAAPGAVLPDEADDPRGLVWFRTSGTTGRPKWIGHTREGLLLSAAVVNQNLEVAESDVWGLALPLHHVGGFGVVARAYEMGCELSVHPGDWNPEGFAQWVAAAKVNHLSLVPTQVHDLVKAGMAAPGSLRTVVVGGGKLEFGLGHAARELGWPLLASYGMTEAASQIATQGLGALDNAYQTAELPVLAHWEVRTGTSGCLQLKGGSLFVATMEQTAEGWCFSEQSGDWFETSDRVEIDGGSLTVIGRVDRMVKVLGELVDLSAIEESLGLHGVAIVGVGDERQGSSLVACSEVGDVSEAIDHYNQGVAGPWRIAQMVKVESLPRSLLGKVRYGELP